MVTSSPADSEWAAVVVIVTVLPFSVAPGLAVGAMVLLVPKAKIGVARLATLTVLVMLALLGPRAKQGTTTDTSAVLSTAWYWV